MVTKKKSKKQIKQPTKMAPERYMREKARKLPIDKCYVNSDWQEEGLANVTVTRLRLEGHIAIGFFLVDTFCLGVKMAELALMHWMDMKAVELILEIKQLIATNYIHTGICGTCDQVIDRITNKIKWSFEDMYERKDIFEIYDSIG